MAVYKRFNGKKVKVGDKNYSRAMWFARGEFKKIKYSESVPLAKTKKEAEDREHEIKSQILTGDYEQSKRFTTFAEYVEKFYLPRVRTENISFHNNKKFQINRLKNYFGKYQLKHISRALCEKYREFRKNQTKICQKCARFKETCYRCEGEKAKYKPPCWSCRKRILVFQLHKQACKPAKIETSTVNRDLTTLSDILSDAVIDREIKENPMAHVSKLAEPEPRNRILSKKEKQQILEFFAGELSPSNSRLRAMVMIAVTTGWREDRIMKLAVEHLDYETESVFVTKSKQSEAHKKEVSSVTWAILDSLAKEVVSGTLFRNMRTGEPLRNFPRDSWTAMLSGIGIKNLTFHDLRHQAASELMSLGVHLFEIQGFLDHKRVTTTQRYLSVTSGHRQNNLERLGDAWRTVDSSEG